MQVYPLNLPHPPPGFSNYSSYQLPHGGCQIRNGRIKCVLKALRRKESVYQLSFGAASRDPEAPININSLGRFRICNWILLFDLDVAYFK